MSPAEPGRWRGRRAWAVAAACALLGLVATAVSGALPHEGGEASRDALWPLLTGVWAAHVVLAYPLVWARGTWTLGRPREPLVHTGFAVLWAAAEVGLLLSAWALVHAVGWGPLATWGVAFLGLGALQGAWHALFWDVQVAPAHNDPGWNVRKVLVCHVPNLALGLAHLERYGEPVLAAVLWSLALLLSAHAMRFPRPSWQGPDGRAGAQRPSRSAVSTTRLAERTTASSTIRPRSSTTTPEPEASDSA